MRYREIGTTGVQVSEIGFGGEWVDKENLARTRALFDRCEQAGINIVDCWMSDPDMRSAVGFGLAGRRDRWVIQGHIGSTWQNGQYVRSRSMVNVVPAFEDLLKRLGTDHVEFGMLHFVDTDEDYDVVMGLAAPTAASEAALGNAGGGEAGAQARAEAADGAAGGDTATAGAACQDTPAGSDSGLPASCLAYAQQLKAAGVIGHIGMSTHNPAIAQRAAESGVIELILFSCNPAFDMLEAGVSIDELFKAETFGGVSEAEPGADGTSEALDAAQGACEHPSFGGISPERARLYATCEERGVGITVMKGFAGGRLLSAETSPFGVALTPTQCLHYALTRPAVASVLVGFSETAHIDEAVSYESATPEQLDYASVLAAAPRNAFAGRCTYCGHCAPCPSRIDVALVQKYADLAQMQPEVPESVADHYRVLGAHASDCVACGSCEERCPFGVPVVARMEEIAELFGR